MTREDDAGAGALGARIACPFVYANGRVCVGHVVRVEVYKADMDWSVDAEGVWHFGFRPRSHFHLFCSEKGNHAGFRGQDPVALKYWFDHLPEGLQRIIQGTQPGLE
jgi:hypothetical protein